MLLVTTGGGEDRRAGTAWGLAAVAALILCITLAGVGYSVGPRILGTLGVVGVVAPVLLGLRWSRNRRQ